MSNRRRFLQGALGGLAGAASVPLLSGLPVQAFAAETSSGKRVGALPVEKLSDRVSVISNAPGNVVALSGGPGVVLVDSGSAALALGIGVSLGNAHVGTLINTHYHADQTGGNVLFGGAGASIVAHEITKQWLATDYYVPSENHYVKALPKAGVPTVFFRGQHDFTSGPEHVECGYLLEAHTRGDIYVYFRDSNVLAAGDVVSPQRDPVLDWFSGAWIGGRVDGMDVLLKLANDQTKIVPAYGPVLTKAQLQTERDMMAKLFDLTTTATDHGRSAQDMLNEGVMNGISRKFQDPYKFLYDVAEGNWAHYTNFGGNVV